jgi:hypothetical protein
MGRLGSTGTLERTMQNTASLGKRAVAWIIVIAVGLLALKLAIGAVVGLVTFLFTIAVVAAVVMAALWAIRHL